MKTKSNYTYTTYMLSEINPKYTLDNLTYCLQLFVNYVKMSLITYIRNIVQLRQSLLTISQDKWMQTQDVTNMGNLDAHVRN
jgi:hypothetical protein